MRVLGLASVLVCLLGFSADAADEVKSAKAADEAKPAKAADEPKPAKAADEIKPLPENVDPTQVMLDRVGKMPLSAQRAWLRRLEARALRAAQLSLDADDVGSQQARVHAQLHQKIVTWQTLRTLIDEINLREKTVIDRLVRQYGNLVFDTFHKQTDTYNQRRQAWLDVYIDWERAGKPFDQKERLIDWLRAAIRSATPGTTGPIPEKPTFQSEQPTEKAAAKQPAETAKPPAASGSGASPEKAKPEGDKPSANVAPNQPSETLKPQEPSKPQTPEKPKVDVEKPTEKAATKQPAETTKPPADSGSGASSEKAKRESEKPSAKQPAKTAEPQEPSKPQMPEKPKANGEKPSAKTSPNRPAGTAKPQTAAVGSKLPRPQVSLKPKPAQDADKELAKRTPRRAVEPPLAAPQPAATLSEPAAAADLPLRRHELDQAAGAEQMADALIGRPAIAARRDAEPQAIRGASVQLPGRPSTAIAVSLPKVVEPVLQPVAATELPGQDRIKSLSFHPSAGTVATASSQSSESTVEIEQEELSARIRGCNLAFRALEAELDEKGDWTAARLEPLVDRLEILVLRRHDLELFRGVVPKQQRSSIESLASAKNVFSPVAAHIVEARARSSDAGFTGTEAERQRELGRLGELSRRLAALAEK